MTSINFLKHLRWVLATLTIAAVGACAGVQGPPLNHYDLGAYDNAGAVPGPKLVMLEETVAPAWLDRSEILYRLTYQDDQQVRAYGTSHWTAPPSQLITYRLKQRLTQSGSMVLTEGDGSNHPAVRVRIEVIDFSQLFDSPTHSVGSVAIRVSIFEQRTLIAQQVFSAKANAAQADAIGGVHAMAQASDMVLDQLITWLSQQTKRP